MCQAITTITESKCTPEGFYKVDERIVPKSPARTDGATINISSSCNGEIMSQQLTGERIRIMLSEIIVPAKN
jgi:hypothetical protein